MPSTTTADIIFLKLGLTATPKDYLKRIDPARVSEHDPRDWERRQLLDTYKTFGCKPDPLKSQVEYAVPVYGRTIPRCRLRMSALSTSGAK